MQFFIFYFKKNIYIYYYCVSTYFIGTFLIFFFFLLVPFWFCFTLFLLPRITEKFGSIENYSRSRPLPPSHSQIRNPRKAQFVQNTNSARVSITDSPSNHHLFISGCLDLFPHRSIRFGFEWRWTIAVRYAPKAWSGWPTVLVATRMFALPVSPASDSSAMTAAAVFARQKPTSFLSPRFFSG